MNYTVYDVTMQSPSNAERDVIWSILLFGDKIEITSGAALIFNIYGDFPHLPEESKFFIYSVLAPLIEKNVDWSPIANNSHKVSQIRNKKNKTGDEMKMLGILLASLRKVDNAFVQVLREKLAFFNYDEIAPLTREAEPEKLPDIRMRIGKRDMDNLFDSDIEEHFIKILTNALAMQDNILVFDERIEPFISKHTMTEYQGQNLTEKKKTVVFSEKVFRMPLCYTLKSNEIRIARSNLKEQFQPFHECVSNIALGKEDLKSGMEKLRALLPELQSKIDSNEVIQGVRNRVTDISAVDVYLAFTSTRGMLKILGQLSMLNKEELSQAEEIITKHSSLDALRPFMFINHD